MTFMTNSPKEIVLYWGPPVRETVASYFLRFFGFALEVVADAFMALAVGAPFDLAYAFSHRCQL